MHLRRLFFLRLVESKLGYRKHVLLYLRITKIQLNGVRIEDETEFNYEAKGPKGPAKWGTLKAEWKLCGIGKMQSPINLTDENVKVTSKLGSLRSRYLPANATLKNRGHDIMVNQLLKHF